jgi:hypothetical protein
MQLGRQCLNGRALLGIVGSSGVGRLDVGRQGFEDRPVTGWGGTGQRRGGRLQVGFLSSLIF